MHVEAEVHGHHVEGEAWVRPDAERRRLEWGAEGPDSFDCSGLSKWAWAKAGVYLPHYSVAQYETSTPISVGSLRPGDLLFWGSSSSPSSISMNASRCGS